MFHPHKYPHIWGGKSLFTTFVIYHHQRLSFQQTSAAPAANDSAPPMKEHQPEGSEGMSPWGWSMGLGAVVYTEKSVEETQGPIHN